MKWNRYTVTIATLCLAGGLSGCGSSAAPAPTVTIKVTVPASPVARPTPTPATAAPDTTVPATPTAATETPVTELPSESPTAEASPTLEATPTPTPTATKKPFNAADYATLGARSFKKLIKTPDRYVGKKVVVYGNVFQFDAATGECNFLADTAERNIKSYGYFNGENSWIEAHNSCKIFNDVVEGDILKMYVEVGPSYSYDTQAGGNTTVPTFLVDRLKVVGSTD